MSLNVDSHARGRSKSPGRQREPSRSRDGRRREERAVSPNPYAQQSDTQRDYGSRYIEDSHSQRSKGHGEDAARWRDVEERERREAEELEYEKRRRAPPAAPDRPSYSMPGSFDDEAPKYADYTQKPIDRRMAEPTSPSYASPGQYRNMPSKDTPEYAKAGDYRYAPAESTERGFRAPPPTSKAEHSRNISMSTSGGFNLNIGSGQPSQQPQYSQPQYAHASQYMPGQPPPVPHAASPPAHSHAHSTSPPPSSRPEYAKPVKYQYAQPEERIQYKYSANEPPAHYSHRPHSPSEPSTQVVTVQPGSHGGRHHGPPSPGLAPRMHSLSISSGGGGHLSFGHGSAPGGLPPGSPLLEAYHGTYQSISPMPSPLQLPTSYDDGIDDLPPLSGYNSDSDGHGHGHRRKVKFYDASDDAKELATALKATRDVDPQPFIEILPALTPDQIMELRVEYKKIAKSNGKGINIAKHIKMKFGPGALGKIIYVTALGKWESEAYWANFWYQSNTSRRELLIESLMGRTNKEIREIKDAFSDKRYHDSLEKCMKAELKADKFRVAVLEVLEERKQEESNYIVAEDVRDDARRLYEALTVKSETAMIHIVVSRSETHLREVMKAYEKAYRQNFAREMLKRSTNLVGETLAHILNGIINRPVRDALLLHQAISETSKERTDLLISRLVRYHWDRPHLERIKVEYRSRYGKELTTAVAEGTKGDFGEFCVELCLRR
ncbi:MAG: hypothetical protein M1829_001926 [Trizodia sp. TS-e1964]|nr:MAG: hypothetical protein M1829_001926 [Trizodia sp. TS-e1964]